MQLEGPYRYAMTFNADKFEVQCPRGMPKFSGRATSNLPKLYVVSFEERPVYVGVTMQSIRDRLRLGWKATGANGYHGYAWRKSLNQANLDIWCHIDAEQRSPLDIETVEAEVVFLIRTAGQWPEHQTEIHFHPSTEAHREAARKVLSNYKL